MPSSRLREQLAEHFAEWRAMLGRQTPIARQIVKKPLAPGTAIRFTTRDGYFEFEADGVLDRILADVTQQFSVASLAPASWNQIAGWLKQIDGLRQAA